VTNIQGGQMHGKKQGQGHPLPASDEARHREIPEGMAEEKGRGEEGRDVVTPHPTAVNPDGEPYRYDDLGRGPGTAQGSQDGAPEEQR
jgi:hypothetical protein